MRGLKLNRFALFLVAAVLAALMLPVVALAQGSAGAATDTPDITDDLGSWAALVGILLPAVVALLQKVSWPDWVNALVFGFAVVVASVVYGYIRYGSDLSWAHWEGTLLAIVLWGLATYHAYWKRGPESIATKLRQTGPIK